MAESEEELKNLLMKVKEESEKADLKLNIQKTKIMASSPITSRQIDGETMETVTDFIFLGSRITADADWSHEIKRCLLLGPDVMILVFWMLSFKPTFSLSSFTFIKMLFSSSSLSSISLVSFAYEVIDISPGNLDYSLCFIQPCISHDVLCI